jgi:hypothetical protein
MAKVSACASRDKNEIIFDLLALLFVESCSQWAHLIESV